MSGILRKLQKTVTVQATGSGVTHLIAAQGVGTTINVHSLVMSSDTAAKVTLQDTTGTPVVLLNALPLAVGVPAVFPLPAYEAPYFTCSPNKGLDLNPSTSANITVHIIYTVDGP